MSSVPVPPFHQSSPEPVFRLSVDQYHTMIEAGVLTDDDPVELLEGILVFKMPKKPKHPLVVRLLTTAIDNALPAGWHFRAQKPITLEDGEPEPDGAVARGEPRDYAEHHPRGAEVGIVIEISDTTLERDRGIKLRSYARAGIPIYWIVDLTTMTVECYSSPESSSEMPTYRERRILTITDQLDIQLNGATAVRLAVREFLA